MKKYLPLVFTALASAPVFSALADDSWYLGALYNAQEISSNERDFNTAGIIAGYKYNDYFSLETRLAKGTSGYSSFYGSPESREGNYSEDIDSQISLLLKASYPLFESFNIYGLAGYSKTELETKGLGQSYDSDGDFIENYSFARTDSYSGFSYGLGLSYQVSAQFNIFADYQILPDFEPAPNFSKSWNSTTIGVNYSF